MMLVFMIIVTSVLIVNMDMPLYFKGLLTCVSLCNSIYVHYNSNLLRACVIIHALYVAYLLLWVTTFTCNVNTACKHLVIHHLFANKAYLSTFNST